MKIQAEDITWERYIRLINYLLMTHEEYEKTGQGTMNPTETVDELKQLLALVHLCDPSKYDLPIIHKLTIISTSNKWIRDIKDVASDILKSYKDRKQN